MDFSFDVTRVLREPVTVWDKKGLFQATKDNATRLRDIIDKIGASSAKAQGLGAPVTSYNILLQCPEQRLYLFMEDKKVVGMIKIGTKKLFVRNELDVHREITPMCVLDFYVHESRQRTGRGKMLFEAMLEREKLQPWNLGYDRPSPKFISFLRKHYDLSNFIPQANNYVVFKKYFDDAGPTQSRNEQPNASVSMRPLTGHRRSNSFDGGSRPPQYTLTLQIYYTPQKPQSRPEAVTPLSLNQLKTHNPFSSKQNTRAAPSQQTSYSNPQRGVSPKPYSPSPKQEEQYYNDMDDYHNNNDSSYPQQDLNGTDERYQYDDNQSNHYDDNLAPEDFSNTPNQTGTMQASYSSPAKTSFATTSSSSYGSHSPNYKRSPSPGPNLSQSRSSPISNSTLNSSGGYNKSHYVPTNNLSTGHFALGGSELSNNYGDTPPIRGRSPARQRSESPFAETANLSPAGTRPRSQSVERSHTAPKGLGTLGSFNQSFTQPLKYEKELADPPHRPNTYKDSSMFPPRRDEHQARAPPYRLAASSNINSREMDRLEDSMRNALTTIDSNEKRLNLIETGGYRAISPEPRRPPSQGDHRQTAQARSIFSPVQPTGSPTMPRAVSPAKFAASREEENFSKSDYHKRFHNENPSLMSSPPHNVRVHPNSRSRQSINY